MGPSKHLLVLILYASLAFVINERATAACASLAPEIRSLPAITAVALAHSTADAEKNARNKICRPSAPSEAHGIHTNFGSLAGMVPVIAGFHNPGTMYDRSALTD